jgi:hypothetical protein
MRRWNVPRRIGGALRWNPEMPEAADETALAVEFVLLR